MDKSAIPIAEHIFLIGLADSTVTMSLSHWERVARSAG